MLWSSVSLAKKRKCTVLCTASALCLCFLSFTFFYRSMLLAFNSVHPLSAFVCLFLSDDDGVCGGGLALYSTLPHHRYLSALFALICFSSLFGNQTCTLTNVCWWWWQWLCMHQLLHCIPLTRIAVQSHSRTQTHIPSTVHQPVCVPADGWKLVCCSGISSQLQQYKEK